MYKALFYKEWLKTRWAIIISAGILLLALIKMVLEISYSIRLIDANNMWNQIVMLGYMYYGDLLYLPTFIGLAIAITQFMPEISDNKLKLTLHLPMPENTILLSMLFYGIVNIFILFIGAEGLLLLLSAQFFPAQINISALVTTMPWFLAGMVTYLATATIFVEPRWPKRIIMGVFFLLFVETLLNQSLHDIYTRSLIYFVIISLLFSISILYTAQRFRKGVLK